MDFGKKDGEVSKGGESRGDEDFSAVLPTLADLAALFVHPPPPFECLAIFKRHQQTRCSSQSPSFALLDNILISLCFAVSHCPLIQAFLLKAREFPNGRVSTGPGT